MSNLHGPVWFRDCTCPGTPHPDGDVAYLRPKLSFEGGAEAASLIAHVASTVTPAQFELALGPVFIKHGVAEWNVVDEDGDPVPVTHAALAELDWAEGYALFQVLGDNGPLKYGGQVLAPFQSKKSTPSKRGRTERSTPDGSSSTPPSPPEPSSSPS